MDSMCLLHMGLAAGVPDRSICSFYPWQLGSGNEHMTPQPSPTVYLLCKLDQGKRWFLGVLGMVGGGWAR